LAPARYLVVDVGGGSTEIIAVDAGRVVSQTSIPIGAVRLTERHLHHDPPDRAGDRRAERRHRSPPPTLDLPRSVPVIGTAGTATTLAAVKLGLEHYDPEAVDRPADSRATPVQRAATPGCWRSAWRSARRCPASSRSAPT